MTRSRSMFAPLAISPSQALRLEILMKQQVQNTVLARTAQLSNKNNLSSDWRLVSSFGQLKTLKTRGMDPFSSTSSWATTSDRCNRATTGANGRVRTPAWTRHSQRASRSNCRELSFSCRTVGTTSKRDDALDPHRPPLQSYRTFGHIQGNYRDIISVHYATNSIDFVQQQKLISPTAIDGAVLHTIRTTKDSYLGIKWLAVNTFAGKRDICFVEMVGYTIDTYGHEIGYVALASVDVPECPELTSPIKITRVRMKHTMLVVPAAAGAAKNTSEIFIMGASETNEPSIITRAQHRLHMAVLSDLSLVIDSQNIAQQKLALHKNWVPDESRASCSICSRNFHFIFRRRHHCRLCGDIVCKTCYVNRAVPGAGVVDGFNCKPAKPTKDICQTKFCIRCVMGLRAMDKRAGKFNLQISKTMLLHEESSNVSESTLERRSPANVRDSSITYFKRGTNQKYTLDLDQLYTISAMHKISIEKDNGVEMTRTSARSVVAGLLASYGSGGPKHFRSSLSMNPVHSKSYSKLCVLNRHSATSSLSSKSASTCMEEGGTNMFGYTVPI